MAVFRGFSTINKRKKFVLTDYELIKRDLLNGFQIREGTVPGQPQVGTRIWSFIFEPLVVEVRNQIEDEVRRVIDADPRVEVDTLDISADQNTEVKLNLNSDVGEERLFLVFNQDTESLNIVS